MPKPLKTVHKADTATTAIDKLLIVHIILGLFLYVIYWCQLFSIDIVGRVLMIYAIGMIGFFYFSHYKVLANTKVYLQWFLVALVQLLVYYGYRSKSDLMNTYGPVLTPLRSLFVFLVLYQILRQTSLYFNHKEPIMMTRSEYNLTALEYAATLPIFLISLLSCFNF